MLQSTSTQNPPKTKTFEAFISPKIKVTCDPRSKTRVITFPFDFPNEEKGAIIICRLTDEDWTPAKDIKSITINFT